MKLRECLKSYFHFLIAWFAYRYYGRPARKLIVIGVTGTKGKSTTCRFIASVLEEGGYKVGLLSTVEFQIGEKRWLNNRKMTMLGRGGIQKMLKQMVEADCQYAIVETSSEGILQYRHVGLLYDIAVFTNLGTEHSERHGGFENLRRDKGKLFRALTKHSPKVINGKKVPRIIIANADDPHAGYYLSFAADAKWAYGIKTNEVMTPVTRYVRAENIAWVHDNFMIDFKVEGRCYHITILGEFNVYNALAAIACGFSQGMETGDVSAGLMGIQEVPGRMEFIEEDQPFKVIVDYAHELMSLTALFTTLRRIVGNAGKVIGIIGSDGGGRDKGKRTEMGKISGQLADIVIVTDVNCFDEDPCKIAEMLAVGARQAGKKDGVDLFIEVDRRKAIAQAFALAQPGDVVAITAKGTEPCIVVANGKKIPWDDRQVARELLQSITTKHVSR